MRRKNEQVSEEKKEEEGKREEEGGTEEGREARGGDEVFGGGESAEGGENARHLFEGREGLEESLLMELKGRVLAAPLKLGHRCFRCCCGLAFGFGTKDKK